MSENDAPTSGTWDLNETQDLEKYPNGILKLVYKCSADTPAEEQTRHEDLAKRINQLAKTFGQSADQTESNFKQMNDISVSCFKDLRTLAKNLHEGNFDERMGLEEYGRLEGKFETLIDSVNRRAAAKISLVPESTKHDARIWALEFETIAHDLTPEQIALSIEIQKAYDVVDIVMDRRQLSGNRQISQKQGLAVRKSYVQQLKEIADEGLLSSNLTGYAARKLDLFKDSFVQREANRVKNQHVRALGIRAALFAFTFLVLAGLVEFFESEYFRKIANMGDELTKLQRVPTAHFPIVQDFMFLAVGASVGSWMSFTLRKVELGFDDLILLEPDRLNPSARIIFVVILTCVVGGILQLDWVSITIAGSKTPVTPGEGPGVALLLGILCGIAERSLSGAIVGRASSISGVVSPANVAKETSKGE